MKKENLLQILELVILDQILREIGLLKKLFGFKMNFTQNSSNQNMETLRQLMCV